MHLRNMNIGDANAVKLDKIGELTHYQFMSHGKTIERYYKKTHGKCIIYFQITNQHMRYTM